jgi:hypothetical protein
MKHTRETERLYLAQIYIFKEPETGTSQGRTLEALCGNVPYMGSFRLAYLVWNKLSL